MRAVYNEERHSLAYISSRFTWIISFWTPWYYVLPIVFPNVFFSLPTANESLYFMIAALLARTISHPSYMVRRVWERDYCSRHAEWKIIDENGMEPKSQRSHFNVRKCSILSIPSATSLLPPPLLSSCAVKTPFVSCSIYLYSFGSTQLLIGVFAIRCWMHEQQFLVCVAGLARLGLVWALSPSMWFSICVILIFQFSTCLRRTTNKTKTKYRQLNAEWTANSSLRSLTLYPAVCFIVPNASSVFIVYFFAEASTRCTE